MILNKRHRTGPAHPLYRGGMTHDANGYIVFSSGEYKGKREHVVVAERMIGRPLDPDEVVHHANGQKADNRPENLMVMKRRDHQRVHLGKGQLVHCRSCGRERWLSPFHYAKLGPKGYACRPCGGRWA